MNNKPEIKSKKGITSITARIEINATKAEIWEVLRYPDKIVNFHPLIKSSCMLTEVANGNGSKRHCDLLPMGQMDELISEWDEGNSYVTEVIGGKMLPPYHFMMGKIELSDKGANTEVQFSFSYKLRYGAFGKLLDAMLIRPQFKKAPPKYIQGLKHYMEKQIIT